jgi:hypothetical protein
MQAYVITDVLVPHPHLLCKEHEGKTESRPSLAAGKKSDL